MWAACRQMRWVMLCQSHIMMCCCAAASRLHADKRQPDAAARICGHGTPLRQAAEDVNSAARQSIDSVGQRTGEPPQTVTSSALWNNNNHGQAIWRAFRTSVIKSDPVTYLCVFLPLTQVVFPACVDVFSGFPGWTGSSSIN